jgi:hypothetical protein
MSCVEGNVRWKKITGCQEGQEALGNGLLHSEMIGGIGCGAVSVSLEFTRWLWHSA